MLMKLVRIGFIPNLTLDLQQRLLDFLSADACHQTAEGWLFGRGVTSIRATPNAQGPALAVVQTSREIFPVFLYARGTP